MADVKGFKEIRLLGEDVQKVEIEYDFAKDGGAVGALDLCKFLDRVVVVDAYTKVDTAVTSSGSATVIWGVKGGTTNAFMDTTAGAKANLTANKSIPTVAAGKALAVAPNGVITMTIGTEDLDTGKLRFVMLVQKF